MYRDGAQVIRGGAARYKMFRNVSSEIVGKLSN